jgi:hypothetical protein
MDGFSMREFKDIDASPSGAHSRPGALSGSIGAEQAYGRLNDRVSA